MIPFLKYSRLYAAISISVLLIGIFSIFNWGFTVSNDFTGGTEITIQTTQSIDTKQVESVATSQGLNNISITHNTQLNLIEIKTAPLTTEQEGSLIEEIENQVGEVEVVNSETIGPVIGAETLKKTTIASAIAIIGILLYITFSFRKVTFAVAAISALLHDTVVVVGVYSLVSHFFGAELDTLFVTALLTTMSFSVHDTIVVFDEIRAYQKKGIHSDIGSYADKALTNTMVRSLNNSFTIMFMLLAIVLLGGSTIRFFAVALLVGTITGTYSSPFVATPVAVLLEKVISKSRK